MPADTIRRLGAELAAASRPAALPPGVELTGRNATATTAAVLILNAVVGAVGRSVQIVQQPAAASAAPEDGSGESAALLGLICFRLEDYGTSARHYQSAVQAKPVFTLAERSTGRMNSSASAPGGTPTESTSSPDTIFTRL